MPVKASGANAQFIAQAEPEVKVTEGMKYMHVPFIHKEATGEGTVVGIIDSGIDVNHPFFAGKILGGRNFCVGYDPTNFMDDNGHGTHVAGTVAMVAPGAKLLIAKALDRAGSGEYEWIGAAVRWLVDNGAHIINMSLGGPEDAPEMHAAIQYAVDRNVSIICAAGNEGDENPLTNEVGYPGKYEEVIAVGAVYAVQVGSPSSGNPTKFTSSGKEVDVAGPGYMVLSAGVGGGWVLLSGTSMATPHIAGAAAILRQKFTKNYNRPPKDIELYGLIIYNTVDTGITGFDVHVGAGAFSFLPVNLYMNKPPKEVKFFIGEKAMYINGTRVELDVAPFISEGRTFLPVRPVAESGDGEVSWNQEELSPNGVNKGCVKIVWPLKIQE